VNGKSRPWTAQEEEKLRSLASIKPLTEIAKQLNRTEAAVLHRSQKLGVTLKQPPLAASKSISADSKRWSLVRKSFVILSAAGAIIGAASAIATFLPRVSVDIGDPIQSSKPLTAPITVTNTFVPLQQFSF
jgi:hypothetical protein